MFVALKQITSGTFTRINFTLYIRMYRVAIRKRIRIEKTQHWKSAFTVIRGHQVGKFWSFFEFQNQ